MRITLVRLIVPVLAAVAVACGGDSGEGTPSPVPMRTSSPTSTPVLEATATPAPTRTPVPEPTATAVPYQDVLFKPVDRGRPLTEWGVYLLDVETMEVWLTGRGGAWSPDGRALASGYCCLGAGEGVSIQEIPSGAAVKVPVPGDVTSVAWAPDSQKVAFLATVPSVGAPGASIQLFLLNRDGSGLRQVTSTDLFGDSWGDIRWLDGGTVVNRARSFADPAGPSRTYFSVDLSSGAVNELAAGDPPTSTDPRLNYGERSPDGGWIAYEDEGLYLWDQATGTGVLVDDSGYAPAWSPDGTRLLYAVSSEGRLRLPIWHLLDLGNGATEELSDVGLWAHWLPDGRVLHAGWWCDYDPATPGGIGGVRDVTLQTVDASEVLRLSNTPDVYETEVSASPGGDIAVFVPREPIRSLELVDLQSGVVKMVVRGPDDNMEPIYVRGWSPDGRYLLFSYGGAHGLCD